MKTDAVIRTVKGRGIFLDSIRQKQTHFLCKYAHGTTYDHLQRFYFVEQELKCGLLSESVSHLIGSLYLFQNCVLNN